MAWTEELTWDNSEEIPTFLLRKSSSKGEKPTGISTWKAECVLLFRWLFETCAISTDPRQRFASPLKVLKVRDGLEFHGSLQCLLLMLKSQKMRAVSWPQWKKKWSSWLNSSFHYQAEQKTHLALTFLRNFQLFGEANKAIYLLHSLKLSWNKSIGVIFLPPGPMLPIPMPLFKWFASIGWPPSPNPMPIPPRPSEENIQISKKPSFHSLTKQQVLFLK